jgi:glycosyltransferase involved in cell wall biosynthesis
VTGAKRLMHVFPTFAVGGSQVRFAMLANHWGQRYRHAILAMDGVYDAEEKLYPGLQIDRLKIAAPKKSTLRNMFMFRDYLRQNTPDLLVTYNWGALEWALANRPRIVPHIHFEDGFGPDEADSQLYRRVLARRLALAKSTLVVPSLNLRRLALECWRIPVRRIEYIPNGIDCARFVEARNGIGVPPGRGPVIGTVTSLRREKNIGRLIKAVAQVRSQTNCRLVIAGDGPERENLELLARSSLPANCFIFTGHVSSVEDVYAALDIFALSSDTEQMPTSLMEAMAAGLPVVSTDVGDVSSMVSDESRPFVVRRDDESFGEVLFRLVADERLRTKLGDSNRRLATERFGLSAMLAAYDLLFSRMLAG